MMSHIIQSIPKNLRPSGLGAGATGTDGLGMGEGGGTIGCIIGGGVMRPRSPWLMEYQFWTSGRGGATIGDVVIPDGEDE